MPSWKKLIVSGSDASLSSLTATSYGGNISGSATSTGSFGYLLVGGSELTSSPDATDGSQSTISGSATSTGSFGRVQSTTAKIPTLLGDVSIGGQVTLLADEIQGSYNPNRLRFPGTQQAELNDVFRVNSSSGRGTLGLYGNSARSGGNTLFNFNFNSVTNKWISDHASVTYKNFYINADAILAFPGSSGASQAQDISIFKSNIVTEADHGYGRRLFLDFRHDDVDMFTADMSGSLYAFGNISGSATSTGSFGKLLGDGSDLTGVTSDVVNDTSPQLGGNLDLNSNDITGTGNIDITGNITAQNFIVSSSVTSITYQSLSGSTIFGDTEDDTHQFTGYLLVTGSNIEMHSDADTKLRIRRNQHATSALELSYRGSTGPLIHSVGKELDISTDTLGISLLPASGIVSINDSSTQIVKPGALSIQKISGINYLAVASGPGSSTEGDIFLITGSNGNIGIANKDPQEKLDVTGNIQASGNISGSSSSTGSFGVLKLASYNSGLGGSNNSIFGKGAGVDLTSGNSNTLIGTSAGANLTTDSNVVAIGQNAGSTGTTKLTNSVLIGYGALQAGNISQNSVVIGTDAGYSLSSTHTNGTVALGHQSQYRNQTGRYNTGLGYSTLRTNIDGDSNTAVGYASLYFFEAASDGEGNNTAVGTNALNAATTGTHNTAVGSHVARTGTNNLTTGTGNTLIGSYAALSSGSANNQTVIGKGTIGIADNSVTIGNTAVTDVYFSSGSTANLHTGNVSGSSTSTGSFGAIQSAGNITPKTDDSVDLGSADLRFQNVFTTDLQLNNEGTSGNEVDGTTGSWTIQEGEEELYLLNRKSGKKYKFMLQEIK